MKIELDATEEKIVNATFDIIQKEGFAKATTKKISSAADVNEVTIFRKFKNKNNLIEITKAYYTQQIIETLEEVFDFTGDEEIGEYLQKNFYGLLEIPDEDFAIIKVAMEEIGDPSERKHLIAHITDSVLDKYEAYFDIQKEKGILRDIDTRILASMCYSLRFQATVLYRIYNQTSGFDESYGQLYLDILFNGIKK